MCVGVTPARIKVHRLRKNGPDADTWAWCVASGVICTMGSKGRQIKVVSILQRFRGRCEPRLMFSKQLPALRKQQKL